MFADVVQDCKWVLKIAFGLLLYPEGGSIYKNAARTQTNKIPPTEMIDPWWGINGGDEHYHRHISANTGTERTL